MIEVLAAAMAAVFRKSRRVFPWFLESVVIIGKCETDFGALSIVRPLNPDLAPLNHARGHRRLAGGIRAHLNGQSGPRSAREGWCRNINVPGFHDRSIPFMPPSHPRITSGG